MSERVFTRITRSLVAGSPERGHAPTLDGAGPNAEEVALAVQTISPRQHQSKHEPNEAKRHDSNCDPHDSAICQQGPTAYSLTYATRSWTSNSSRKWSWLVPIATATCKGTVKYFRT